MYETVGKIVTAIILIVLIISFAVQTLSSPGISGTQSGIVLNELFNATGGVAKSLSNPIVSAISLKKETLDFKTNTTNLTLGDQTYTLIEPVTTKNGTLIVNHAQNISYYQVYFNGNLLGNLTNTNTTTFNVSGSYLSVGANTVTYG